MELGAVPCVGYVNAFRAHNSALYQDVECKLGSSLYGEQCPINLA